MEEERLKEECAMARLASRAAKNAAAAARGSK